MWRGVRRSACSALCMFFAYSIQTVQTQGASVHQAPKPLAVPDELQRDVLCPRTTETVTMHFPPLAVAALSPHVFLGLVIWAAADHCNAAIESCRSLLGQRPGGWGQALVMHPSSSRER